jgi:histidine triad (HIT) family protein
MANGQMSEEQVKALQEKLKNMSPEELKEFQKRQCIFCQIIAGKVASKKIYDDDKCIAILDINPANPGHVLLMPKEHYAIMPMIPKEYLGHLAMVSKALSHVLLNSLKAGGTNIFIANGVAAGQRAQHFMLHIIPRKEKDGVNLAIPGNKLSAAQMSEVKKSLDAQIARVFKKEKEVIKIEEKKEEVKEEIKEEEKQETKEQSKEEPKKTELPETKKKEVRKEKQSKKEEIGLDDIAGLFK